MNRRTNHNQLHRLVKLAIDSGEVPTIADAERIFAGYRLGIQVGKEVTTSPTLQASLLTAVNTGRRCFLGGVQVSGNLEVPLRIPWRNSATLREAVIGLQGTPAKSIAPDLPLINIGDSSSSSGLSPFSVNITFDGWKAAVVPTNSTLRLPQRERCTPAGVLSGALAVSEAFQFIRGGNPLAGKRELGLSLWEPHEADSWLTTDSGPSLESLPSRVWILGLGHLGQAYLWTMGFLPYAFPGEVQVVLQDFDDLEDANDSTSLLTDTSMVGKKKTRAMAAWCDERGFVPAILERRFAPNFRVADDEPRVLLCGVDNQQARAVMEDVGFTRIIEAGLGKGPQEFLTFQVHNLPSSRSAHDRWRYSDAAANNTDALLEQPAYQALARDGYDACGLALLAGRSVGASFVGALTSTIVISELLRMTMGERLHEVIDGDLRLTKFCNGVFGSVTNRIFNPGLTAAERIAGVGVGATQTASPI